MLSANYSIQFTAKMRRRLILLAAGALLLLLYFAVTRLPGLEPLRSWRIKQSKPLFDGISMQVEDLHLYPSERWNFLRVKCRYLGGDPNKQHYLRASIRASMDGPEIDPGMMWQVGIFDDGKGGIPKMWEFRTTPEHTRRFVMRIYYRPKDAPREAEQYVDYDLPYLPKLTPNGEVGA